MLIQFEQATVPQRLHFLIEYCIYAVVLFLPLSLFVSTFFLAAASFLWLAKIVVEKRPFFRPFPFDKIVFLYVVLAAVSVISSPDRSFSYYNYYHLMGRYIALYYLVIYHINGIDQLKKIVWSLLGSACIVALYGFYQYTYGMDVFAFEWVDGEQFPELKMRVFSTFQNPNILAGFLVIILAILPGLGLCQQDKGPQFLFLVIIGMLGSCLILTYSRGAWISILAVFVAYGIFYNRKVLWLLLAIPILALFSYEGVIERLISIINPTDTSSALRWALWESTIAMIVNNPFTGIGWGAYWMVYHEYDFFIQNPATTIFHAHNMYLHIAAEIGIPGFIVFLGILYGHIRLAFAIIASTKDIWMKGLMFGIISAFLGVAVNGLTDHTLYNTQLSMVFWLLNAIIVVAGKELNSFKK